MWETVLGSPAVIIALVTRAGPDGAEVLVIEHPTAGVGFPAGTLEQGEDPAVAASRGVAEMTGLRDLQPVADLGWARRGPPRRLLHLNLTRRTPMHWWVLVDERGGHCFHCGWLPLADAVLRARSVMAEWPAEVVDAVVAQPGPTPADLPPLFSDALVACGAQHVSWQGRWFLQRWLPGADVQPERVQAFAVTATGQAVLVSSSIEGSDWGLPGGGIEPGEGALEALAREIAEEACARLIDADYLGSYEGVEPLGPGSTGPRYQAKYWARIELDAFVPRFEIRRRSLVPYRDAPALLTAWRQPAAVAFLAAGVAAEDRRRAAPSGCS